MIFEFDRTVRGRPYPNLARHDAEPFTPQWRQFSKHWPFSEPPTLVEYLTDENVAVESTRRGYLVAVSFFDFTIDWPEIIPAHRLEEMRQGLLDLVFFYSEGDNPGKMRQHLVDQLHSRGIPESCLVLITANSAVENLPRGHWFADDEMLFRKRNRSIVPCLYHERPRKHMFTALVRTHKWWRATVMADIWRRGWHEKGFFSYNPDISVGDCEDDNPIQVDDFPGLRTATHEFLTHRFRADDLDSSQHNDHHLSVAEHYDQSYLNLIIETHMDVDQSDGVFLTEKTFKPIKNAQPFLIFGAVNSLARLRDLGYRTFHGIIDDSYDSITDTTQRYRRLMDILEYMIDQGPDYLHRIYIECQQDLIHNQRHFLSSKQSRLNTLLRKITCE